MLKLTRWTIAHRRIVVVSWIVLAVGVLAVSQAVGTRNANNFSLPNTDSQRAADLLQGRFPAQAGDADQIVFRARTGKLTDASTRAAIPPVLVRIARLPHVAGVVSPYAAGANGISKTSTIGFATVAFDQRANELPKAAIDRVINTAETMRSPTLQVELGGQAIKQAEQTSIGFATGVGLVAAVVVLLLSFGSLLAMGLPIVTALFGLGAGLGVIGLGSQLVDMVDFSSELALMIGLGVGIHCGVAIAASLAVLLVLAASLTLLPALLTFVGNRVGRSRRRSSRPRQAREGFWTRWVALIQRRPAWAALASTALLLALAAPALGLRLGASDSGNDPASQTTRKAYDLLAAGFGPGFNGPLQVAVQLPRGGDRTALVRLTNVLHNTPGVASVAKPQLNTAGDTAAIAVYPTTSPQSEQTTSLVKNLRNDILPPLTKATGARVYVGGATAIQVDFARVLSGKLPLFIGVVVLLSALLLLVVFRSLLIPLQAALMNLLSIAAALGVVQAIFQRGWLGGLLGIQPGPIEAFIPVMVFAIVFGLSMDYEVFLVSRIHEEWQHRGDASAAVREGLARTGRVITAAAAVMVVVFASFAMGDDRVLKLFGIAMATAVFLDAILIRTILLPAVLQLFGRRTWAFPGRLDRRLPRLAIEPTPAAQPAPALEEAA